MRTYQYKIAGDDERRRWVVAPDLRTADYVARRMGWESRGEEIYGESDTNESLEGVDIVVPNRSAVIGEAE